MRLINLAMFVVLILGALFFANSQTTRTTNQNRQAAVQAQPAESFKAKKILVKELPKDLEGVVIEKGVFKVKAGYEFRNPTNNTVVVALKNGGATGTFSCTCSHMSGTPQATGDCKLVQNTETSSMSCKKADNNGCTGVCFLDVTVNKLNTRLAIF
jgi:hypothetical protein